MLEGHVTDGGYVVHVAGFVTVPVHAVDFVFFPVLGSEFVPVVGRRMGCAYSGSWTVIYGGSVTCFCRADFAAAAVLWKGKYYFETYQQQSDFQAIPFRRTQPRLL